MKKGWIWLLLVVFVFGFVAGAAWYRFRLWPADELQSLRQEAEGVPQDFKKHLVVQYEQGVSFYSDRDYYDEAGAPELRGTWCIQLPRHATDDIVLEAELPITVFRLVTINNDNGPFIGWTKTGIKPKVHGRSSVFDQVVAKKFQPGTITVASGGPVAASPMLVKVHGQPEEGIGFKLLNR